VLRPQKFNRVTDHSAYLQSLNTPTSSSKHLLFHSVFTYSISVMHFNAQINILIYIYDCKMNVWQTAVKERQRRASQNGSLEVQTLCFLSHCCTYIRLLVRRPSAFRIRRQVTFRPHFHQKEEPQVVHSEDKVCLEN
jgi:hypothetical protein